MDTLTATVDPGDGARDGEGRSWTRLVFVANTDDATQRGSIHSLDDLDEVRFRRGPRAVERTGGLLVLTFPDARMSSEHGRLLRHDARWVVDDPSSKNGTVVDGTLCRRAVLRDGAVVELGRSFFVLRDSLVRGVPPRLLGDVDASALPPWPLGMATFSPGLANELEAVVRLATTDVSLVLLGETGTGKDLLARGVHALSGRTGALVPVNCGALPPALVESELFGHRRGAFSGAVADRLGLVRSADRGTLFLDEIGELPVDSQTAFLRVLQEREVVPIGDDRAVAVDVRLIAATLCDLDEAVASGRFRADLYGRIAGHTVRVPPLRERREDLGLLLAELVPRLARGRTIRLSAAGMRALLRHDWPRNIRELQQVLATAIALAPAGVIELEHLPAGLRSASPGAAAPPLPPLLDDPDRELRARLIALFAEHGGNVVAVAEALGKRRSQVYRWIDRFAIDLSTFRRPS